MDRRNERRNEIRNDMPWKYKGIKFVEIIKLFEVSVINVLFVLKH